MSSSLINTFATDKPIILFSAEFPATFPHFYARGSLHAYYMHFVRSFLIPIVEVYVYTLIIHYCYITI